VFSALNTEAIYYNPGAKLPKKEYIFDNMALYFECPIRRTPSDCFFGDFAHWEEDYYIIILNHLNQ